MMHMGQAGMARLMCCILMMLSMQNMALGLGHRLAGQEVQMGQV
jgi:hypothetical protein